MSAGATLPPSFATLIGMLESRARQTPDKAAFRFGGKAVTFATLWRRINHFAAHLLRLGTGHGERIVIAMPNGEEFFFAFYGAQRAGAVAVPLYPGFGADHISAYARLCGAKVIAVRSGLPAERMSALLEMAARDGLTVTTVEAAEDGGPAPEFPPVAPTDIAFIQYTSGSTGDPKGVQISHDNLLTNMRQMIDGMAITTGDVFVSWLPVYHDMGLILMTMVPFYLGLDLHLLPTDLRHAGNWLRAIEANRATFTAAPDFAYRLCLRQIREPKAVDLSSLRVALNAAEPVRRRTVTEFERAFGLKNVITPAYGLAEATVGVCTWPPGRPCKVDSHGHVSVGRPFRGVEMAVLDDGAPAETGVIGEIAVASEALPIGYLDNPEANEALFWRPGHILSGDLGYIDAEGDHFIVGRSKNTIKQAGRTIHAKEIEEIADDVDRVRRAAAVGIDRQRLEGEQVHVFAEISGGGNQPQAVYEEIVLAIVNRIHARLGIRPGRVHLVRPRTVPLTHNGKVRHALLKQRYLDGSLSAEGLILFPDYPVATAP